MHAHVSRDARWQLFSYILVRTHLLYYGDYADNCMPREGNRINARGSYPPVESPAVAKRPHFIRIQYYSCTRIYTSIFIWNGGKAITSALQQHNHHTDSGSGYND